MLSRENAVIGSCILIAGLIVYVTGVSASGIVSPRTAVLLFVGVVLPSLVNGYLDNRTRQSEN
ncbi:hypothetical protein [Haloarchaeobius sp. DFWS5]|uniref:hypothetical protein n=1 Tax=Haloarchaeobius sp. DFWS5 TaxID=3446114 RepID=UPI003EBE37D3